MPSTSCNRRAEFVTVEQLLTRRGITPENGVVYYDTENNGIDHLRAAPE